MPDTFGSKSDIRQELNEGYGHRRHVTRTYKPSHRHPQRPDIHTRRPPTHWKSDLTQSSVVVTGNTTGNRPNINSLPKTMYWDLCGQATLCTQSIPIGNEVQDPTENGTATHPER